MSLETISEKRRRVYRRAFDHDEAKRLRAEDPKQWTYAALAEHFGVSETAVVRIFNARLRERMQRQSNDWARRQRRPCLGGCGQLVWNSAPGRSGYCRDCLNERRMAENPGIRENELRCVTCGEWKPDSGFYKRSAAKGRRGRTPSCKPCMNAARRDYRARHRERENAYNRDLRRKHRERRTMARFIVLQPDGNEGVYEEVERVDAVSAEHAIEKAAKQPGEFIAVTEGQFKIRRVAPIESLRVIHE